MYTFFKSVLSVVFICEPSTEVVKYVILCTLLVCEIKIQQNLNFVDIMSIFHLYLSPSLHRVNQSLSHFHFNKRVKYSVEIYYSWIVEFLVITKPSRIGTAYFKCNQNFRYIYQKKSFYFLS